MDERGALDEVESKVVEFVREFRHEHGAGPTDAEGAAHFGWASGWSFGARVKSLVARGYLRRTDAHRSLDVVDGADPRSLPIIGVVAAGAPLPTFSDLGRFSFHEQFPDPELVVLKVKGRSMVDAQIADGDWVIIRRNPQPEAGSKVVCSIDDELTLKVLRRTKGEVWLYPCNRDMKAFKLKPDENTCIIGVLVGVVRKV